MLLFFTPNSWCFKQGFNRLRQSFGLGEEYNNKNENNMALSPNEVYKLSIKVKIGLMVKVIKTQPTFQFVLGYSAYYRKYRYMQ